MRDRINHNNPLNCRHCDIPIKPSDINYSELKRKNPRCNDCRIKQESKWRDLKSISTQCRITRIQYNELLLKQDNVCAICKKSETRKMNGKIMRLSVDHCHATGKVRGLLCNFCNRSLGLMRDCSDSLRAAADYLDLHANT